MTLQKGYVSDNSVISDQNNFINYSEKDQLFRQTDSIANIIKLKKKDHEQLSGNEINYLFENLHDHLMIDKKLQAKINDDSKDGNIDSIAIIESLFSSAKKYEETYRSDKYLSQSVNRGDISLKIPKGILKRIHRYLKLVKRKNPNIESKSNISDFKRFSTYRPFYHTGNFFSSIFGNFAGLFHGHIGDQQKNIQLLKENLEPFDIVLSKSRKHLTDKFIPGYFGHAAIWMGNYPQLQKLGLTGAEQVRKNKEALQSGQCMLESLRSNTQLNSLKKFADGDDYLIIRYNNLDNTKMLRILESLRHIGKKYDFNFNVESPDRIFCTELIFYAYDFIKWEAERKMRRYTLEPDNLVQTALNNPEFEIVLWISQGQDLTLNTQKLNQMTKE